MPTYHSVSFKETGQIDFYGNLGACAQWEDKTGQTVEELFSEGKKFKLSEVIEFLYECHLVACIRLSKEPIDFKVFKAFAGKDYTDIFVKVTSDVISEIVGDQEKKTNQRVKR